MKVFRFVFYVILIGVVSCAEVGTESLEERTNLEMALIGYNIPANTEAPLRHSKLVKLNISLDQAFELIAYDLPSWFDGMDSLSYYQGDEQIEQGAVKSGSYRIAMIDGQTLIENINGFKEGSYVACSYDKARSEADLSVTEHLSVMTLDEVEFGDTIVSWHVYYNVAEGTELGFAAEMMSNIMDQSIENLIIDHGGKRLESEFID
ncbi:hypothetical protein N9W79_00380 [bacterium]|nr:hypothetical protein [bacterium]